MIVIGIIAVAMAIGAPRLLKKDNKIKPVARHLMVLAREVRNRARLTNCTMRLAFQMDPTSGQYWVEKGSGPKLIDPHADEKKDDDKDEEKKPKDYQIDSLLTKKKQDLPNGFRFASVETTNAKQPATEGMAYVHFFPEGQMEAAAVQITNGEMTWTLMFNPLTGQADIIEEAKSLKDAAR